MIGLTGLSLSGNYYNPYSSVYNSGRVQQNRASQQGAASGSVPAAAIPAARPNTPVQPVRPVTPAPAVELDQADMMGRLVNDPAAGAVRGRLQYPDGREGSVAGPEQSMVQLPTGFDQARGVPATTYTAQASGAYDAQAAVGDMKLPAVKGDTPGIDLPGAVPTPYDSQFPAGKKPENVELPGSKSARQVAEEGECQTCKNRKYVDGSDDPGVSFKTPTHISPEAAASAVRGHEMEHVSRNQAEARREGREVVNQTVTYHTAICPECGRVYISGGTTQTTTASANSQSGPSAADTGAAEPQRNMTLPGSPAGGEDGKKPSGIAAASGAGRSAQ